MDHPLFYHPNITVLLAFGLYHPSSLFILWVYISKLQRHLGRWEILNRLTFPLFIPSTPPPTPLSLPVFQEKVRFAISGSLRTVKIHELSHSGKDPDTRQNKCQRYLPRKRERTQLVVTFWFLISPLLIPVLLGNTIVDFQYFLSSMSLWAMVSSLLLEDAGFSVFTHPSLLCPFPFFPATCQSNSIFVVCSVIPSKSFIVTQHHFLFLPV